MTTESRINPGEEYQTLRQELLEAKRYVFERPLAIAAVAAAGIRVFDTPYYVVLMLAASGLTLFNFWFTVNRVHSACRIVAYIQLVLEPSPVCPWIGWENALRQYRVWLKTRTLSESTAFVNERLQQKAIPDALMYYPAIYYFHCALIAGTVIAVLVKVSMNISAWYFIAGLCALGLGGWSLHYFRLWKPTRVRESIERNCVIWRATFGFEQPEEG